MKFSFHCSDLALGLPGVAGMKAHKLQGLLLPQSSGGPTHQWPFCMVFRSLFSYFQNQWFRAFDTP